jgi:hypothetical protein
MGYLAALPVVHTEGVINEWWNGKDVEGNGYGLDTVLAIGWRDWGKPQKKVTLAGVPTTLDNLVGLCHC